MPRNNCSKEWEIKPLLSGHLFYTVEPLSGHPPVNKRAVIMSDQCPKIIVVKNGKINLYWTATAIIHWIEPIKRPSSIKGLVKKYRGGGMGRSREGVGHEVLRLVQGVGRAIFSYP